MESSRSKTELRLLLELVGTCCRAFPRPNARPTVVDDEKMGIDDDDEVDEAGTTTGVEEEDAFVDVVGTFDVVETFEVVVGFNAAPRPGASTILDDVVGTKTESELVDEATVELEETTLLEETIGCELVVGAEDSTWLVFALLLTAVELIVVTFVVVVTA